MEIDQADTKQQANKKISFRFCRECSNLLYPKEDTHNDKLMFACRTCDYTEDAASDCVYRNSLQEQIAETAGNIEDVAQDPTVGDESYSVSAVDSFMNDAYYGGDDQEPETCTYCGKEILCPYCGGPSDGGLVLEVTDPGETESKEQEEAMVEAERPPACCRTMQQMSCNRCGILSESTANCRDWNGAILRLLSMLQYLVDARQQELKDSTALLYWLQSQTDALWSNLEH